MNVEAYTVTCKKCGLKDTISITSNKQVIYSDSPVLLSSRYRPDQSWGFECRCGNDSRVLRQEKENIKHLVVNGGQRAIEAITNSLKIKDELKFSMRKV